ncbi:MAG TPA: GAF domain-containing protein [Caldithrix abyssi]|uniref:GAF domain-containing protein n=1 Tax=Caldithrix abyssi TaxID=187145 RepID=A0A7V4U2X7_CALAY|nr:GAF domain-containing protein [Caldithrix abyssi]
MSEQLPDIDYTEVSRRVFYELLSKQAQSLFENERDAIANMANLSALLYEALQNVNWVGFYRLIGNELVLGPFQGRVACVRIKMGSGVCGTSAQRKQTIIVDDVHQFSGHIACDARSRSEIVVPIIKNGTLLGVLDIDSPVLSRFTIEDKKGLEKLVELLITGTNF